MLHKQADTLEITGVARLTRVHTNSIKSVWNSGKVYTKQMRGINRKYLQSYLDQFCWRRNNNLSPFQAFDAIIRAIGQVFPAGCNPVDM